MKGSKKKRDTLHTMAAVTALKQKRKAKPKVIQPCGAGKHCTAAKDWDKDLLKLFTCPRCKRKLHAGCEGGTDKDPKIAALCDECWCATMQERAGLKFPVTFNPN